MKFNIEIEIDWINEDYELDVEIIEQIKNSITQEILKEVKIDISKQIAIDAKALIKAKTENLINTMLEKPITISESWNVNKTYDSIYDMVEEEMSKLYITKTAKKGTVCEQDPYLEKVKNYINSESKLLLDKIEKKMISTAKIEAKNAVENNNYVKAITNVINKT